MKRALSHVTIAGYLGILFCGLVSHTLHWGNSSHTGMYFIVWDMYCGWCAYESRLHVIGEGVSGAYYELTPPPWGDFHPHGGIGRVHYDVQARFAHKLGLATLRYTTHEPIDRILVVEECWSKKYNLPDNLWARRYNEPKDRHSYCHLRVVANSDGRIVQKTNPWVVLTSQRCMMDNPRLLSDMTKGHSFLAVDPLQYRPAVVPASYEPGPGVQ